MYSYEHILQFQVFSLLFLRIVALLKMELYHQILRAMIAIYVITYQGLVES